VTVTWRPTICAVPWVWSLMVTPLGRSNSSDQVSTAAALLFATSNVPVQDEPLPVLLKVAVRPACA
jgi:hypothetical protein